METRTALFHQKEIRKTFHEDEWWFVIADVIAALTDSPNPAGYLRDMRRRDPLLAQALKGGGKLPPPFPRCTDRGGYPENDLLEYRGYLQAHPGRPQF